MKRDRKILVVDDEIKTTEALKAYLSNAGHEVYTAHNGKDALSIFKVNDITLIILDLMLPDITGEEICQIIRRQSRVPIVMLTAKVEETDFLNGLHIGADDYMTKPVSPRAVVAKVEAILRRVECDELASFPVSYNNNDLSIDFQSCMVKKQGEPVSLTPTEYKLLSTMAKAPNRIFTRDELISFALGDEYDGYDRTIDTYIKGLRSKIELDRKEPQYVVTVHGIGYKFQSYE
ncbi:MAG: response regulator transcription factor [Eubacteriales bacterium]|nr:response regulator transcription factor [Eubacteriales bacterium]